MASPFRPGSFLDRLLTQKENRDYGYLPPNALAMFSQYQGLPPPFKPEASQRAYSDNPWLHSAVNVISHEVSRTKFHLVKKLKNGTVEPVESHQAIETLNRPQPVGTGRTMLTRNQLFFLLTQYLMLNGEGFWLMDMPISISGAPQVLTPLNPAYVYETLNKDGTIGKYIYRLPDYTMGGVPLEAQDVVHFKFTDPKNWYRGHSPVQPIRYAVDTYKEADVLNFNRLKNNAVPGGTLETDKNPSDAERHKLLQAWRQAHGGSENAGKTVMLPNGIKFNPTQQTNQEMQFIEGKNLTRDEILANYRVGMEMFGKTESQTRANADASIYVFARFTILPILELIADTLTNDYLPAFPKTDGMEFIFDDPVPENEENKRATAERLFGSGALTPNELRQQFGLEELDLEGMDTPYLPFSAMPMGGSPPLTETNTNPLTDDNDDN